MKVLTLFANPNPKSFSHRDRPFKLAGFDCRRCHPVVRCLSACSCDIPAGIEFDRHPIPKDDGTLIKTGPYRLVRRPMDCGGILIAVGWVFLMHGWLTPGYAIIMLVFFDFKSRREEEWLKANSPAMASINSECVN